MGWSHVAFEWERVTSCCGHGNELSDFIWECISCLAVWVLASSHDCQFLCTIELDGWLVSWLPISWGRNEVVSIMSKATGWTSGEFCSAPNVHTFSGVHTTALYLMRAVSYPARGKAVGLWSWSLIPSNAKFQNELSNTFPPPHALWRGQRQICTLLLLPSSPSKFLLQIRSIFFFLSMLCHH
jgi:hypothetical protein